MKRQTKMKNIFADKASLILRRMLLKPNKKWVLRDFVGPKGVSLGMAQGTLKAMERRGYVERIKKGPKSFTILTNRHMLVKDWLKEYHFGLNEVDTYYTSDKSIFKKIKDYLKEDKYALTLHSGANFITSYVNTDHIYLYLQTENRDKDILDLRQKLELKELTTGGNIHIVCPFYKKSVFFNCQKIKGYRVVAYLQLYLDLYNYQPRGRDHAEYLKRILEEKGRFLE